MKKKLLSLLMVATLCVSALVGCAGKKEESAEAPAAIEKEEVSEVATTDYPDGTVNVICHAAAGGGSDALARQLAQGLQDELGWTVTVDNKTGGSGSVGMQYVMNAKADGYTIGTAPVELAMVEALGFAEIGPDDVQLLGCAMSWPAAVYVSADAPYNTLEEFVEYCKAHPGEIKISNAGIGSIWHISACVLADKTGIEVNHIAYDGANGAITALLGEEVEVAVVGSCEGYSYVESGDVKCLGVFSEERSSVLPDTPTAAEQGYDIEVNCWVGFLAPKGIDEATLAVLTDSLKTVFESEAYLSFCDGRGCSSAYYTPEEFYDMAKAEYEYYATLIEEQNIAQ